ncbi:hypothetical protein HUG17_4815 [Dermatophagoides farinae]|uniref:Methyltransferase type 11 domain-containing protein n=1 Tax=Dermatophagoides farinae TaxID=6954 RepID=A0A9D4SHX5_DERFA|nr:hypothetical protein HUG17_4815 [Dermatophagoides farinae]
MAVSISTNLQPSQYIDISAKKSRNSFSSFTSIEKHTTILDVPIINNRTKKQDHHHDNRRHHRKNRRRKRKHFLTRTKAIEQAYVHDVYSIIAKCPQLQCVSPAVTSVKQFLSDFESDSLILDVGCADGQYLNLHSNMLLVGMEQCEQWFQHENYSHMNDSVKDNYLLLGDVLYLPFRDDLFDGILCCGVLHHLSTFERRIKALLELARIMRIGGRVLITVTGHRHATTIGNHLQSQDVLIKVVNTNNNKPIADIDGHLKRYSLTASESSASGFADDDHYGTIKSGHSSSNNSELENCYSFFKKAIKRFSLASSSIYPFRNSIDDPPSSTIHNRFIFNLDVDSALSSSFNRSSGCLSQTSQSTMNNVMFSSSSILMTIKEHLLLWKAQVATSIEQSWQSFDVNDMNLDDSHKNNLLKLQQQQQQPQMYHRFSLPLAGLWRPANKLHKTPDNNVSPISALAKSKLAKNKIYASNGLERTKMMLLPLDDNTGNDVDHKDINLNQMIVNQNMKLIKNQTTTRPNGNEIRSTKKFLNRKSNKKSNRILLQKSLSTESSTTSIHCCRFKLLAYYSMPELNTLFDDEHTNSDQHVSRKDYDSKHKKTMKSVHIKTSNNNDTTIKHGLLDKPEPLQTKIRQIVSSSHENHPIKSVVAKPKAIDVAKFAKKLLRQRSFSADYQPEEVKLQPDPPRRFSASPNIETHRYNNVDHIPHHQQISMDSEESFVTIIPANRSTRESINISDNMTDFDIDEEDECTSDLIMSPNEIYSCSSEEEDAYCESLDNDTSNDTSISSVLEATIKSVSHSGSIDSQNDAITTISSMEEIASRVADNSSAAITEDMAASLPTAMDTFITPQLQPVPTTLHQYYHIFRYGELEQIIEEHVQNLHVIDSYYNEIAMCWCVVAEKINVWTI